MWVYFRKMLPFCRTFLAMSVVSRLYATALFFSALANILFALSAYVIPTDFQIFGKPVLLIVMAIFWGINGWFQSMGFPPIAKNLSYWFANKERGVKWSLWSSSHEVGTYLSMILSGYLITHYGWESVFYVPAFFAILFWFFQHFHFGFSDTIILVSSA